MIQYRRDFGFDEILTYLMNNGRVEYNTLHARFDKHKYFTVAMRILEIDGIITTNTETQFSSAVQPEYWMTPVQIAKFRASGGWT